MNNRKRFLPRGSVFTLALVLAAGLLIGVAAGIVPRFFKVDPMKWIKPNESEAATTVRPFFLTPKEVDLDRLTKERKEQKADLDKREKSLNDREKSIGEREQQLEAIKKEVTDREERIKQFVQKYEYNNDELKNVKNLAKDWLQMQPAELVPLINKLKPEFAVMVLGRMPNEQVGAILAEMSKTEPGAQKAAEFCQGLKQLKPPKKTTEEAEATPQ